MCYILLENIATPSFVNKVNIYLCYQLNFVLFSMQCTGYHCHMAGNCTFIDSISGPIHADNDQHIDEHTCFQLANSTAAYYNIDIH